MTKHGGLLKKIRGLSVGFVHQKYSMPRGVLLGGARLFALYSIGIIFFVIMKIDFSLE